MPGMLALLGDGNPKPDSLTPYDPSERSWYDSPADEDLPEYEDGGAPPEGTAGLESPP